MSSSMGSMNGIRASTMSPLLSRRRLGGVDGFDEDEPEGEGNNGPIVLGGLLAAERHALEALELAHELLDAGTSPVECSREERRPVLGRCLEGNHGTDAP